MPTDPVNAVQRVYDKTPNRQNVKTAKYRYDRKILKFVNLRRKRLKKYRKHRTFPVYSNDFF